MTVEVLKKFSLNGEDVIIQPFGSGLINHTWLVKKGTQTYILQKINTQVFVRPQDIDNNISLLANYLTLHAPDYLFTKPITTIDRKGVVKLNNSYYRIFPFVEGSHSYTVVEDKTLAYEAAKEFGKFTRLLAGFDISNLRITLPDFHNLSLRYKQFEKSIKTASQEHLKKANKYVQLLINDRNIVIDYEGILTNPAFKKRVTHHDTKISNVLFNSSNKGLCVIDLDTVMPGYFISDVGDMMRTYLSPAGEEETDFSKVYVRDDYFEAIVKGYLSQMQDELTTTETKHFIYAGRFMIYMQALRFLADYLNNDIYYGAKYPDHNLNRAINQITLLQKLQEKEPALTKIVEHALQKK